MSKLVLYKLNNLFIYFWKNWIYTYRVEKEKNKMLLYKARVQNKHY
jgi:hypothetical protein